MNMLMDGDRMTLETQPDDSTEHKSSKASLRIGQQIVYNTVKRRSKKENITLCAFKATPMLVKYLSHYIMIN